MGENATISNPFMINKCALPREAIPTQWLNEVEVRDALLRRMPLRIGPIQLDKLSRLERGNPFGNLRPFRADRRPVVGRQNENSGKGSVNEIVR
jgi:hypothetical protein